MADVKTKSYKIVINGLTESISAVESLNKQLDNLDAKIKSLSNKTVKVATETSASSKGGGNTKVLSQEEALLKQIEQTEQKIAQTRSENYQELVKQKDALKEVTEEQKKLAATERLSKGNYANTMAGMKQQLADIKTVRNYTDVASKEFDELGQKALALTNNLKKYEEETGQFSRNVGNYANGVAEGMQKVKVQVGDSVREFSNAREASRTLNNELKAMAVNGQSNTKEYKELRQAVMELESTFNDAKKPMDNLMDTMQSIVAIGSLTQSFSALFGFDDSEIQRSIQKLVALQNILNSINTLNNQIQTREGIGKWLSKGNKAVDSFTNKLFGLNTTAKVTQTTLETTGTAGKTAATGLNTSAAAAGTAAKSFTAASLAATALNVVLKALGIGIVISAVSLLISGIESLISKQSEALENQKKLADGLRDSQKDYAKVRLELSALSDRLKAFNGTKQQEKKLVDELNSKYGDTLGQYKSIEEWQNALIKKSESYSEVVKLQAENQAILNAYTEDYVKLLAAQRDVAEGGTMWNKILDTLSFGFGKSAKQKAEENEKDIQSRLDHLVNLFKTNEKRIREISADSQILDFAPQIDKNGKKTADAAKKMQEEITRKQIEAMQDGLNKTLMQLDEEKRQTINKIKENGYQVSKLIELTEETYAQKRAKAISDHLAELTKTVNDYSEKIKKIRFQIDTKELELQINDINEYVRSIQEDIAPLNNTLTTNIEYQAKTKGLKQEDLLFANTFSVEKNKAQTEEQIKEYFKWLDNYVSTLSEEVKEKLGYKNLETGELQIDYNKVEDYIREHYKKELEIIDSFGYQENASLKNSFEFRYDALKDYYDKYINEVNANLVEEQNLKIEAADKERKRLLKENGKNFKTEEDALKKRVRDTNDALSAIENMTNVSNKKISESFRKEHKDEIEKLEEENGVKIKTYKDYYDNLKTSLEKQLKETENQLIEIRKQYADKTNQIIKENNQKIIQIENEGFKKREANNQAYYNKQLSNYRDFLSKINSEASKNPVTDKAGWGVVNATATKKNYREILAATDFTIDKIRRDREKLSNDFKNGLISPENYNATLNQLNDIEKEVTDTSESVKEKQKMLVADFMQSIQMYLQETLNSFNTIMQAVWQMEDNEFDDEQERLDKENEMIQDKLSKQADIISQYKSTIDSIEDELATSRGDRRQHLIDQLNAEMEAERRAQKEKENLQKQEERNKKKQEDLEKKRKKAQYERDKLQAIVNGAMAVTYAAINTWPIPAIPMMALAASTTAAQLAIMAANKPYAKGGQLDGGVAVGNRHRDGGIKVLGGRAEIEGGEFITNRLTTEKNIDLLEFVNSKKKKIDVNDMLEFYSSGSVKKNIMKMSPKAKFADGGYIPPTLSNNIDLDDRLMSAFENYSNRPVVVSVVDITNKQEDVRRVQTLAGL